MQILGSLKEQTWFRLTTRAAIFRPMWTDVDLIDSTQELCNVVTHHLVDAVEVTCRQDISPDNGLIGYGDDGNTRPGQESEGRQRPWYELKLGPPQHVVDAVLVDYAIAIKKNCCLSQGDQSPRV